MSFLDCQSLKKDTSVTLLIVHSLIRWRTMTGTPSSPACFIHQVMNGSRFSSLLQSGQPFQCVLLDATLNGSLQIPMRDRTRRILRVKGSAALLQQPTQGHREL